SRRLKYSGDFLERLSRPNETTAPFRRCFAAVSRIGDISATSLSLSKSQPKIHTNRSANPPAARAFTKNSNAKAVIRDFLIEITIREVMVRLPAPQSPLAACHARPERSRQARQ